MTWKDIPGWFDYQNVYDRIVATAPDDAVLVEVGCWRGQSTAYLGQTAKDAFKGLQVFAVDHFRGNPGEIEHQVFFEELGTTALIREFHQNMLHCDLLGNPVFPVPLPSTQASRLFDPESLHAVFIDGEHSPVAVMADLISWWPLVAPGGILAGHDYVNEVRETVDAVGEGLWGKRDNACPFNSYCWWVEKLR